MKYPFAKFLVAAALLACQPMAAQGVLNTNNARIEGAVPRNQEDELKHLLAAAWASFVSHASLLNPLTGKVDETSISAYKKHFTFNGKVVNDLVRAPGTMHHSDYASQVLRRLEKEGVRCWFEEASLVKISYDAAGFYKAEIKVRKMLANGLDLPLPQPGQPSTRCFELRVRFEIPEEELTEALIASIGGTLCPTPITSGQVKTNVALLGQLAIPNFRHETGDERIGTDSITIDGKAVFSGGVYLRTQLRPKSKVSLGIGLSLSKLKMEATILPLDFDNGPLDNGLILDTLQETVAISYFELPLGVHVQLAESEKMNWTADVAGVTSIRGKTTKHERQYAISSPGTYVGEVEVAPADYWTFFSLRLGVSGQYFFSENLGLEFGAAYSIGISPLFGYQPTNDFFLDAPARVGDPGLKVFDSYLSSLHASSFGLRLGLVYQFDQKNQ